MAGALPVLDAHDPHRPAPPDGLAPRVRNLPEWAAHLLETLDRAVAATADPGLVELFALAELSIELFYPADEATARMFSGRGSRHSTLN